MKTGHLAQAQAISYSNSRLLHHPSVSHKTAAKGVFVLVQRPLSAQVAALTCGIICGLQEDPKHTYLVYYSITSSNTQGSIYVYEKGVTPRQTLTQLV